MDQLIEREKNICAQNYAPLPVVLNKGEGCYLWDQNGKRYIDMMSAYSAVSLGHNHPELLEVLSQQAKQLSVTSRAFHTDQLAPMLETLCSMAKMEMALPMNTGAEAVETAIKAARRWGYEKKGIPDNQAVILVAEGNFHGRTTTITSFSTEPDYKKNFGPFTPGFQAVAYGDMKALEAAISKNVCAFLVEPMQGEAGIIVPPKGWLCEVQALCKKHEILLILDEIQTGLARTGKDFAYMHDISAPDGLIVGKALGGGILPVSAFLANREVMKVFAPGSHGSTFGGNPLASAVAQKALELTQSLQLSQRSATLGALLKEQLQAINSPVVSDIRGQGLWIGVDIDPQKAKAKEIVQSLAQKGILTKETHDTVIRLAPPLIITQALLEQAINDFKEVIATYE